MKALLPAAADLNLAMFGWLPNPAGWAGIDILHMPYRGSADDKLSAKCVVIAGTEDMRAPQEIAAYRDAESKRHGESIKVAKIKLEQAGISSTY